MGKPAKPTSKPGVPHMILFCGLPGSGKSTLSSFLKGKGWEVISQDELGTQNECVKVLEKALKKKKSIVLDRCNVTPSERKLWVRRARAVDTNIVIETIHFDVSPDLCKARAMKRTDHATVDSGSASDVVDSFCRGYKKPEKWEGPYDECHTVSDNIQLRWIKDRFSTPGQITLSPPPTSTPGVWDDAKDLKIVPKSSSSKSSGARCDLLVLRHAERTDRVLDYRGKLFFPENSDDCEITKEGRTQAKKSGEYILKTTSIPPVTCIYSSPFTRCVETACEVALQLSIGSIRIEPGLSEFLGARLFHSEPVLNNPTAVERYVKERGLVIDYSTAPEEPQLPTYPETGKSAKQRVIDVADALRIRHSGSGSVLLVTHSHALVEISNISKSGSVNSRPGYCGLTHIDPSGTGLLLTDTFHQSHVAGTDYVPPLSEPLKIPAKGHYSKKWNWVVGPSATTDSTSHSDPTEQLTDDTNSAAVSNLLQIPFEAAVRMFTNFSKVLQQGSDFQQQQIKKQWNNSDPALKQKVTTGLAKGWFKYKSNNSSEGITIHTMRVTPSMEVPILLAEMCESSADIIAIHFVSWESHQIFVKLLSHCNDSDLLPHKYIPHFLNLNNDTGKGDCVAYLIKNFLNPIFERTLLSDKTKAVVATVHHEGVTSLICLADFCCSEDTLRAEAILAGYEKSLSGSGYPHMSLIISQNQIFSAFVEIKSNSLSPSEYPASVMHCYGSLLDGMTVDSTKTKNENTIRLRIPILQECGEKNYSVLKFPRTRHLYGVGSVGRDDLLMSADDVKPFHDNYVTIEEKIDGANLGISFDQSYQVIFKNRGKLINSSSGTQWSRLELWYDTHKTELFELLSDRYSLYGEWMVARHGISYTALPDYFIAFDLYDKRTCRFLGITARDLLLSKTSISVVKTLSAKVHPTKDDILSLLATKSFYTKETIEGLYLRIDSEDGMWLNQRAKIVNAEFLEGIEEGHWASRVMEKNLLAH